MKKLKLMKIEYIQYNDVINKTYSNLIINLF